VTIHAEHPFLDPEESRDPVRRLRGRVGAGVSLWTAAEADGRAGLTVSSYAVATGDPGHVIALIDAESALYERLLSTRTAVVHLLHWRDRDLADAFAGTAPAPGGAFRMGEWTDSTWGPLLTGVGTWAGVRLAAEPTTVGWTQLVDTVVEHVVLGEEEAPLVHRRGRYQRPS